MIEAIYKIFLSINSTSWVVVMFGIKEEWVIAKIPAWVCSICLLIIPVILSGISVWLTLLRSKDMLEDCKEVEEVNTSFLPTYLGYFFVGLGVEKWQHLFFVYLIILLFTYVAQAQYFNPILLLLGYRFYSITSGKGTKIFLITKKNLRNARDVSFHDLRRINDTTYIAWRDKAESSIS